MAKRLASAAVAEGLGSKLAALTEMELKSTASWALVPSAQGEWVTTAVSYLEQCARNVPTTKRPR
ncbi:MAG: hypothetical protein U0133_06075 [Gemmatimonadales bacterium]